MRLTKAQKIAKRELKDCYSKSGILAGLHHFTDYWARDGFFACLGSLAIKDDQIVKTMIDFFFSHQREDGLIPYRIMNGPVTIGKYLGKPKKYPHPKPTYKLRGFGPEILDGTTLTLIIHGLHQKDLDHSKHRSSVVKAFQYLTSKEKHGLLWDGVLAEWNDTAYKWGNLLYSNILYWYAAYLLSPILLDTPFKHLDQYIAYNLRKRLWNGKFFSDWHDYKRQDYFYPFGNYLSIAWGLANPKETKSILNHGPNQLIHFTLDNNTPPYPFWRIDILNHLIGLGGYQNHDILWWQPVLAYLKALKIIGHSDYQHVKGLVANKIIKDDGLFECYHRNGSPLKSLFYQSEKPFSWAAGMYLWATI